MSLTSAPPSRDGKCEADQGGHHNGGFEERQQPCGFRRLEGAVSDDIVRVSCPTRLYNIEPLLTSGGTTLLVKHAQGENP